MVDLSTRNSMKNLRNSSTKEFLKVRISWLYQAGLHGRILAHLRFMKQFMRLTVRLRPPSIFVITNHYGPSSKTVLEVDGQLSKIRSPQIDNLGRASESVHEMDGQSSNFGPLPTWTCGRVDRPRRPVIRGTRLEFANIDFQRLQEQK